MKEVIAFEVSWGGNFGSHSNEATIRTAGAYQRERPVITWESPHSNALHATTP